MVKYLIFECFFLKKNFDTLHLNIVKIVFFYIKYYSNKKVKKLIIIDTQKNIYDVTNPNFFIHFFLSIKRENIINNMGMSSNQRLKTTNVCQGNKTTKILSTPVILLLVLISDYITNRQRKNFGNEPL